jgi:hypothetical protein
MIDMEDLNTLRGRLWRHLGTEGYEPFDIVMNAIDILAESQNEIQKDLEWIKKRLKGEI